MYLTKVSTALRFRNYRYPYIYICKQTKKNADSLLSLLHLEDEGTTIYRNVGKCQTTEGYIPDELSNHQTCFRILKKSQ